MSTCQFYNEVIHRYLDGEATKEETAAMYQHMSSCAACEQHLKELKKSIAFIQSSSHIEAPANLTACVMSQLPKQKKVSRFKRKLQRHPILVAVAVFLLMMSTSVFASWDYSGQDIVVSGNGPFVIDKEKGIVTVPKGAVIEGDLMVRNGELQLEGEVKGDVLLLNSELNESLMASVSHVTGEIEEIDQALAWTWYNIKQFFIDVVSIFNKDD
ncbi:anti-sigma factor family protein [Shouchella lonarensis]|uniref:Anti-sigma-W factor RsiW n=1 Tax=Shouchella lonarensis TaxID=1464122 RepID=A0A1G6P9U6_9BACI|nr:anti-sigma factor [Shouchella lonarensis]SDC76903.1 Transmembrane transcriptional regulator (anti-sigma factor RsiW) [Shouchella lonarensis]